MATIATFAAAEIRAYAQKAARVWVDAHAAQDFNGNPIVRFIRYMSPGSPDNGAWVETDQDDVN